MNKEHVNPLFWDKPMKHHHCCHAEGKGKQKIRTDNREPTSTRSFGSYQH